MGHNDYTVRPFHLPEEFHQTHWTTKQMCRAIQRRNPEKPGFWYCSYAAPHPPITPPAEYLAMYGHVSIEDAVVADWSSDFESLPHATRARARVWRMYNDPVKIARARRGFYAQCTYIDHQLRLIIGTLREEGLLDSTWIVFTADHGDMLGDHQQWAKPTMLDGATRVPLLLVPPSEWWDKTDSPLRQGKPDDRLAALRDIMPTILDACGVDTPETVEGYSLLGGERRESIYCEHWEDEMALRMVRDERFKLIWYPVGNRFQLFDMVSEPKKTKDLSGEAAHRETVARLKRLLRSELYGRDLDWVDGEDLVGEPEHPITRRPDVGLVGQRGWRL